MHTQPRLAITPRPRVTAYPRNDTAYDQAIVVQVGDEWIVTRWNNGDAPQHVAQLLRDAANWIEGR